MTNLFCVCVDVHSPMLDWRCGKPVAVAKETPPSLELPPQLTTLKLQPHPGCSDQELDLSAVPAGLMALQLAGFSRITAPLHDAGDPPIVCAQLSQPELAILSFTDPLRKPAGIGHLGLKHRPGLLIQATAGLAVPLPITMCLRVLVLSTQQVSCSILQHHWPLLESLSLSFAGIDCPYPHQQAGHLLPSSFPQLQQLMLGSSGQGCTTDLSMFTERRWLPGCVAVMPAPASSSCSEFHREETGMDISGCCTRLGAFQSLRRVIALVPCWDVPDVPLPQGCSLEIGACQAGYRGRSGIRCRFNLEHLVFGYGMLCSITQLRLRLMHSVGVPPDDPCVLNLSPLGGCSRLETLVLAVEKELQRAWSISNAAKLPAGASCRIDLCPVSLAPSIMEAPSGEGASRNVMVFRHSAPPC